MKSIIIFLRYCYLVHTFLFLFNSELCIVEGLCCKLLLKYVVVTFIDLPEHSWIVTNCPPLVGVGMVSPRVN